MLTSSCSSSPPPHQRPGQTSSSLSASPAPSSPGQHFYMMIMLMMVMMSWWQWWLWCWWRQPLRSCLFASPAPVVLGRWTGAPPATWMWHFKGHVWVLTLEMAPLGSFGPFHPTLTQVKVEEWTQGAAQPERRTCPLISWIGPWKVISARLIIGNIQILKCDLKFPIFPILLLFLQNDLTQEQTWNSSKNLHDQIFVGPLANITPHHLIRNSYALNYFIDPLPFNFQTK